MLPWYVRGRVVTGAKPYSSQNIQDHMPKSEKGPQHVYSVRFEGRDS